MRHIPTTIMLALILFGSHARAAVDNGRPLNIVFIVADDLGLECVGAYGGLSYRTPHIDSLARSGIRFTHCFSNPYCSPSRAQLLTGRYPLHNGIKRVIFDPQQHREFLDPQKETSFAKLLKQAGYATAIAGKWQLSFLHERDTIRDHGFDEYQCWQIFHDGEKTSRYAQPTLRQNGKVLHDELKGKYGPDVNVDFLIDFMRRHRDQPFMVYHTSLLPHYPWEPTPGGKDPLKPAAGDGDTKYMPDMVAHLDKQVGRIVAAVDELGLTDQTLIIFTGDNGTDRRITSKWTDGKVTRDVPGGKGTMTDAGTRVPLIVAGPGVLKPGTVCEDLIDFSDFLPTFVEIGRAKPSPHLVNGRSFAPQLRGEQGQPRSWIHVQDHDKRYVRNREYILTNDGKLRRVDEVGSPPAKPLQDPLDPAAVAARSQLQAALKQAARSD